MGAAILAGDPYPLGTVTPAFTPPSFSDLVLWADPRYGLFQNAAGTTPAAATNDPVAYETDRSSSGNHLTQSVDNMRPLLKKAAWNGQDVLLGDNSNDNLNSALNFSALTSGWTVFFAARFDGDAAYTFAWGLGYQAGDTQYFFGKNAGNAHLHVGGVLSGFTPHEVAGNYSMLGGHVFSQVYTPGVSVVTYMDGVALETDNSPGAPSGTSRLETMAANGGNQPWNGALGPVMIWRVPLAAADQSLVLANLRSDFGTP